MKQIFLIDADKKRIVKSSISGQVITVLKRADKPLDLKALASRVIGTKSGKASDVGDKRSRVKACAEWYKKNSPWVDITEDGGYFLVTVP